MRVREFLIVGTFFMATGVMLGAFGAHQLKNLVSEESLAVFKTGVQYQFIHGLAMLLLALLVQKGNRTELLSGRLIWIGTILFSGSLYFLSTASVFGWTGMTKIMGPITPLGGSLITIGWLLFLYRLIGSKSVKSTP